MECHEDYILLLVGLSMFQSHGWSALPFFILTLCGFIFQPLIIPETLPPYYRQERIQGVLAGLLLPPLLVLSISSSALFPVVALCGGLYELLSLVMKGRAIPLLVSAISGLTFLSFAGVFGGLSLAVMFLYLGVVSLLWVLLPPLLDNHTIGEMGILCNGISMATAWVFHSVMTGPIHHDRESLLLGSLLVFLVLGFTMMTIIKLCSSSLPPFRHSFLFVVVMAGAELMVEWYWGTAAPLQWFWGQIRLEGPFWMCVYWVSVLSLSMTILYLAQGLFASLRKTWLRKYFHLIALLVFLPGFYKEPVFLRGCLGGVLALMILLEYVRFYSLPPFGGLLDAWIDTYKDSKDDGNFVMTHIYLLFGCAVPLLFGTDIYIPTQTTAGVIILGVGDSVASIVGSQFGRTAWHSRTKKSVEGTIAAIFAVVIFHWALTGSLSPCFLFSCSLALVYEGLTSQVDNLVLPIVHALFLSSCL